jgi:hypothetical protein
MAGSSCRLSRPARWWDDSASPMLNSARPVSRSHRAHYSPAGTGARSEPAMTTAPPHTRTLWT